MNEPTLKETISGHAIANARIHEIDSLAANLFNSIQMSTNTYNINNNQSNLSRFSPVIYAVPVDFANRFHY